MPDDMYDACRLQCMDGCEEDSCQANGICTKCMPGWGLTEGHCEQVSTDAAKGRGFCLTDICGQPDILCALHAVAGPFTMLPLV